MTTKISIKYCTKRRLKSEQVSQSQVLTALYMIYGLMLKQKNMNQLQHITNSALEICRFLEANIDPYSVCIPQK